MENIKLIQTFDPNCVKLVTGSEFEAEREQCMAILHKQLQTRGGEVFYKQPNTDLSHGQASEWYLDDISKTSI